MEDAVENIKPEVAEEANESNVQPENVSHEASSGAPEARSDSMKGELSNDSSAGAPDPQPAPDPPPVDQLRSMAIENPLDPLRQIATIPGPDSSINNRKEASRRVSFPEDGRIVSGYMDPPSPWNDGKKKFKNSKY